jgi:hypothetical protein
MNTNASSALALSEAELTQIHGGGEIFDSGMEMVAEGKDMMKNGNTLVGSLFGLAQCEIGGWYLIIGGVADFF